jgi:predicted DNA-binding transcriptional regulator YafY
MFTNLNKNADKYKNSDRVLTRLILILQKLSDNQFPTRKDLAEEFNVSAKTIQRDINERLCHFPIEENSLKQLKFLEGFSLNKTSLKENEMLFIYLSLSQIKDINKNFEKTTYDIFSKLLTPHYKTPYHIKANAFENIDMDSKILNNIERAIEYRNCLNLKLKNREFIIEPYKVICFDGIWYLLGKDVQCEKIKTVFIHEIIDMDLRKEKYLLDRPIESILDNVHSAWFEDGNQMTIVVKINKRVAFNFKLKNILPSQKIIEEYVDGSLLVEFGVTTEEDIDNIIKAWIPDIEIISPKKYRNNFIKELKDYIKIYESDL